MFPSETKTTWNCYSSDHTTSFNLYNIFFLVHKVIMYYWCCAAKTVNKQGYIHISYQVAEMKVFEYYEYSFFLQIFQVFYTVKI